LSTLGHFGVIELTPTEGRRTLLLGTPTTRPLICRFPILFAESLYQTLLAARFFTHSWFQFPPAALSGKKRILGNIAVAPGSWYRSRTFA